MIYLEEKRDLFSVPDDYYLAQCISADLGMGKGIAVQFNKKFNMKNKLTIVYGNSTLKEWDSGNEGCCILMDKVFNLVTKRNYWSKPTYETLMKALLDMKKHIEAVGANKVAMPMIGCGLDRLEWAKVSQLIQNVFTGMQLTILVCKL